MTRTVHRLIEHHAALRGDAIALAGGGSSCSYRELNAAANVLARKLMSAGFRRGMCAHVRIAPAVELAVILLAILKAGGCYTWSDPGPRAAASIWIEGADGRQGDLEIGDATVPTAYSGSNLPVMIRETDAACVLDSGVIVPHATIVAMTSCAAGLRSPFTGEPGAFDLWVPLMNGVTAVVDERPAVAA